MYKRKWSKIDLMHFHSLEEKQHLFLISRYGIKNIGNGVLEKVLCKTLYVLPTYVMYKKMGEN